MNGFEQACTRTRFETEAQGKLENDLLHLE